MTTGSNWMVSSRFQSTITYSSMQILEECLQILRLHHQTVLSCAFQSYRRRKGRTEPQQQSLEDTWMTEGPMRQNEDDCNLSPNSAPSNIKQVTNSHSSHEGTACRPFTMDASKLFPCQNSPMAVHHHAMTYPLVISTARQVGVIKRYKCRRLGLLYQGTLSCCASWETTASLLSDGARLLRSPRHTSIPIAVGGCWCSICKRCHEPVGSMSYLALGGIVLHNIQVLFTCGNSATACDVVAPVENQGVREKSGSSAHSGHAKPTAKLHVSRRR